MANETSPAETGAESHPPPGIDGTGGAAARTGATLEQPRNFCPYGGLVGSKQTQWDMRKGFVLHGRLKAMGALYVIVAGLAQARELFIDVGFSPLPALSILATMAAATAYLWWEDNPPLRKLRVFEVYFFAAPAAALVYIDWHLMALSANSGLMLMNWYRLLVHMCLLIAGFAIFMPAGWRRTLIFTGAMGALPFVVLEVMRRQVPAVAAGVQEAMTVEIYTGAAMLAAVMVAIAVFGTYTIDTMYHSAAEAGYAGQYHLEKKLGAGGMGEVWLARHKLLTRPAAIKVVRPEVVREAGATSGAGSAASSAATAMKRFEREAQATASLTSPHTIDIYDFGVAMDGTFYYAMEYLDGLDLDSLITEHGPVPVERVIHLLTQACDSLADAHEHDLIHRDVKPGNIFATRMGTQHDFVKVLDFGLVKETKTDQAATAITQEGMTSGTPAFMPPEIALGKDDVDARADIYALGCVGYWLATGQYVFDSESPMGIVVEHVKSEPAAPSTRSELSIPREFDDAILRALAKDPQVRFQSMQEFAEALRQIPVEQPWSQARASEWWRLRGGGAAGADGGAATAATVH